MNLFVSLIYTQTAHNARGPSQHTTPPSFLRLDQSEWRECYWCRRYLSVLPLERRFQWLLIDKFSSDTSCRHLSHSRSRDAFNAATGRYNTVLCICTTPLRFLQESSPAAHVPFIALMLPTAIEAAVQMKIKADGLTNRPSTIQYMN